jgi:glycopeptide antibiotics resistance protein
VGTLRKLLGLISLGCYLVVLLLVSAWPKPIEGQGFLADITNQILMFSKSVTWLRWLKYDQLEALANVLLYVPLGVLLVVISDKTKLWLLCLVPIMVSLLAEGSQRLFLQDRYATANDVFLNSLGGILGLFIAASIRQLKRISKQER